MGKQCLTDRKNEEKKMISTRKDEHDCISIQIYYL